MKVGVPTEIKVDKVQGRAHTGGRPGARRRRDDVHVQQGAGLGSAITDEQYTAQGAKILPTPNPCSARAT